MPTPITHRLATCTQVGLPRLPITLFLLTTLLLAASAATAADRPNILWIVVEDASPHIGCYGETAIETPHLDQLAKEGVRFDKAFVTAPVCSTARSALVSGRYQTTTGFHHHRSQRRRGKGGGNTAYYDSYRPDQPLIPELFRNAGYHVTNAAMSTGRKTGSNGTLGKQDYNFTFDGELYSKGSWQEADGKPFFAQIQLHGGKRRKAPKQPIKTVLPPYYPDHPVLHQDWATYLNSWLLVDQQVGDIVANLKDADVYDNTAIFFITDHGVSHLRGKQFLYEEGMRIPLIAKLPKNKRANTVRNDLAIHIDLAPSSLALADIPIPDYIDGADLFATNYKARDFIVSARDRCDETIECMRALRTPQFKYIRNFMSYRPHAQFNQYKDGKKIVKTMRELHAAGKLNEFQARPFQPTRPPEELYDLANDPWEQHNLAKHPKHAATLKRLRNQLYDWMVATGDLGLIPESILEDLGKQAGSKAAIFAKADKSNTIRSLINVIEAGERKDFNALSATTTNGSPAEKYWAATWLGVHRQPNWGAATLTHDANPTVRIAAALAHFQADPSFDPFPVLTKEITNPNLLVGMYAMNAIEQTNVLDQRAMAVAATALQSPYEFTRRYGKRLKARCQAK